MTERTDHTEWAERFIERYGVIAEGDGLSRIAGRMAALFVVEDGPFSFSQLAERLKVSRGGVSTNTRLLEQLGFIERITKPGERQDYFELAANPWVRLIEVTIEKHERSMRYVASLLDEPELSTSARSRAEQMHSFFGTCVQSGRSLVAELRSGSGN